MGDDIQFTIDYLKREDQACQMYREHGRINEFRRMHRAVSALQAKADLLDEAVGLGSELREALDMGPTIRELCKPDIEGLCDRFDAFLARIKESG